MKNTFTGMLIALALVLAIVIGAVALAENAETEPAAPAIEQGQPEAPSGEAAADSTALQDALKAYSEAKSSSRQEELESELKGYVESGKLTQEQADLILNYYKERQSLRDGVCPNCGYQFQSGVGKGGRMNGGLGGKGSRKSSGFGGKGGRGMMGQQPSQRQDSGSANGAAFLPGGQMLPGLTGTEGV